MLPHSSKALQARNSDEDGASSSFLFDFVCPLDLCLACCNTQRIGVKEIFLLENIFSISAVSSMPALCEDFASSNCALRCAQAAYLPSRRRAAFSQTAVGSGQASPFCSQGGSSFTPLGAVTNNPTTGLLPGARWKHRGSVNHSGMACLACSTWLVVTAPAVRVVSSRRRSNYLRLRSGPECHDYSCLF